MTNYNEDTNLINHLKKGSIGAYTKLYNKYFQLLFVFAYKKIRDEELAKDMVQELFIRLWERRENISETKNFSAYLYVAIRNTVFDYFTHQKVANKYIEFLGNYLPNSRIVEADYKIREKQLAEYIERQIQTLPVKMRRIFELNL